MPAISLQVTPTTFLSDEELLSAIRGQHVGQHPLARLARKFGAMYEQHLSNDFSEHRCCRRELIRAVDRWVADHLPTPHPQATVHTETIGVVIDRIARVQVHAWQQLMTIDPSDPSVHESWYRLAELIDDYTDLTTDILNHARRLPTLGVRQ